MKTLVLGGGGREGEVPETTFPLKNPKPDHSTRKPQVCIDTAKFWLPLGASLVPSQAAGISYQPVIPDL